MKNYLKEYKGHKVPEGATHYGAETDLYYEGFYKEGSHRIAKCNRWVGTSGRIPDHAIELPLAKEEFEPSCCDWFISPVGEKLLYVGPTNNNDHLCYTKDRLRRLLSNFNGCKPLKSNRDIAIEEVVELWPTHTTTSLGEYIKMSGMAYDYYQSLK